MTTAFPLSVFSVPTVQKKKRLNFNPDLSGRLVVSGPSLRKKFSPHRSKLEGKFRLR